MSLREHYRGFPWSYYLDKTLALATTFASILLIIIIWDSPLTAVHLRRAASFVLIIAICIALAKRRLLLLAAAVGFITIRLVIGGLLQGNLVAVTLSFVSASILGLIIKIGGPLYTEADFPKKYSREELLLDVIITPIVIGIVILVFRISG